MSRTQQVIHLTVTPEWRTEVTLWGGSDLPWIFLQISLWVYKWLNWFVNVCLPPKIFWVLKNLRNMKERKVKDPFWSYTRSREELQILGMPDDWHLFHNPHQKITAMNQLVRGNVWVVGKKRRDAGKKREQHFQMGTTNIWAGFSFCCCAQTFTNMKLCVHSSCSLKTHLANKRPQRAVGSPQSPPSHFWWNFNNSKTSVQEIFQKPFTDASWEPLSEAAAFFTHLWCFHPRWAAWKEWCPWRCRETKPPCRFHSWWERPACRTTPDFLQKKQETLKNRAY